MAETTVHDDIENGKTTFSTSTSEFLSIPEFVLNEASEILRHCTSTIFILSEAALCDNIDITLFNSPLTLLKERLANLYETLDANTYRRMEKNELEVEIQLLKEENEKAVSDRRTYAKMMDIHYRETLLLKKRIEDLEGKTEAA